MQLTTSLQSTAFSTVTHELHHCGASDERKEANQMIGETKEHLLSRLFNTSGGATTTCG